MDVEHGAGEPAWIEARFGRGSRYVLAGLVLAAIALIALWAWAEIGATFAAGHWLRAVGSCIVALLLAGVALRLLIVNWCGSARAQGAPPPRAPAAGDEGDYGQTGIWGVGGPSLREPGNTVVLAARNAVKPR